MLLLGRQKIYTKEKEITEENIIQVLKKAYSKHQQNAREMRYLIDFERGVQPLVREKKIRRDIDIRIHDNIANQIKKFNMGYFWSSPIILTQRGNVDAHNTDADIDSSGISALNEMLKNSVSIGYEDQKMAEYVEITGIGHRLIDIKSSADFQRDKTSWTSDGKFVGSLINLYTLDSMCAFCVYHSGVGQRKLLGVSYEKHGGKLRFSCFTDRKRFEIQNWEITSVTENPMGAVPIIEYERAFDRMGCFERNISEINGLNVLLSDMANDCAQRTQEMWWGDNLDFQEDENGNPKKPVSGDWILTHSSEGLTAKIQPLSSNFDTSGTLSTIESQRNRILQEANVPIQYDSAGGGSTGVAMDISSGWSDAEIAATQKQQMVDRGKREELALILKAIEQVPMDILPADNPIRKVHLSDVEFKFTRRKNTDLTTKANSLATLLSHGVNGRHALKVVDMFEDVEQTWLDSKDGIEAYQKATYENASKEEKSSQAGEEKRLQGDLSDQVGNSPFIDGMNVDGANGEIPAGPTSEAEK